MPKPSDSAARKSDGRVPYDAVRKQLATAPDYEPTREPASATHDVVAWLRSHGVRHSEVFDLALTDIDVRRSRANQARQEPLIADSVARYANAFREGAQFPPVVVYPTASKFVLIDGNNRQAGASEAGVLTIRAIAVADDTPGELIQLLTVEANTSHGVTPDMNWRLRQGEHLVALGYSYDQAAASVKLNRSQIEAQVQASKSSERARRLRLPMSYHDLPVSTRRSLNALSDDAVFFQTANLVITTHMTGTETQKLVRDLRKLPSERDRVASIGQIAEDRKMQQRLDQALGKNGRGRGRLSVTAKVSLATALGKVMKVDAADLLRAVVTDAEKDEISRRLEEAAEKLLDLQTAIQKGM